MNPMSSAIKERRYGQVPKLAAEEMSEAKAEQPSQQEESKCAQILQSLGPEEKQELLGMLQAEMAESKSEEDSSDPEMSQSEGEKAELSEESAEGPNEEVMSALEDSRFKGSEGEQPRNLNERVQMNIAKMKKGKV